MGPTLHLTRTLALVGGVALVAAFFMPWFASQGLLLSGQFLHTFLASSSPSEVQRFIPGSSAADLFPICGVLAALLSLVGIALHNRGRVVVDGLVALTGAVALIAWIGGVTRLPAGARWEIGLWGIAAASIAVILGAAMEIVATRRRIRRR